MSAEPEDEVAALLPCCVIDLRQRSAHPDRNCAKIKMQLETAPRITTISSTGRQRMKAYLVNLHSSPRNDDSRRSRNIKSILTIPSRSNNIANPTLSLLSRLPKLHLNRELPHNRRESSQDVRPSIESIQSESSEK